MYLNSKEIGKRIKQLRKGNKMTQRDFAEKLGKSVRLVQKYECGEVSVPVSAANRIADFFGVSAEYILFGDRKEDEPISFDNEIFCPYCNNKLYISATKPKGT